MSANPLLLFITGLPGTGKTTLAKHLGAELHLPVISKDTIKELIFDTLGSRDREWSKKVGLATYVIMDYVIEEHLKSGQSLILESNFKSQFDNQKFQTLQQKYNYRAIQILCTADKDVLFSRFKTRAENGQRHPGHADADNLDEWRRVFATQTSEPLDIAGEVIRVDTTDFRQPNVEQLVRAVGGV